MTLVGLKNKYLIHLIKEIKGDQIHTGNLVRENGGSFD